MTSINNKLSGIQLNCRSLNNKLVPIKLLIYNSKPDIVAFSETWINHNSKYVPYFVNYNSEWEHRTTGLGGGLGLLIRDNIQYKTLALNKYRSGVLEVQAIEVYLNRNDVISVLNIYNPNKNLLEAEIRHYISQLGNKFIILGDFNGHTRLLDDQVINSNRTGKTIENICINDPICLINPQNLYTHCCMATYKRSCLDLCFTSPNIAPSTELETMEDIGSDHLPLKFSTQVQPAKVEIVFTKKWKINGKTCLNEFSKNIKEPKQIRPTSNEEMITSLTNRIVDSAKCNIGQTTGKMRLGKVCSWWDNECEILISEKRRARRIFERYPSPENAEIYSQKLKNFLDVTEEKKKESFKRYVSQISHDTPIGKVWRIIRSIKGHSSYTSHPLIHQGQVVSQARDKTEIFGNQFQDNARSCGKHIENFNQQLKEATKNSNEDYNSDIRIEELYQALESTKDTSPGEDEITYPLIKNLAQSNLLELLDIFNQIFQTGSYPQCWKTGLVIPILKPNKPKEEVTSYRPITLLSCMSKLFERVLKQRLEYIMETRNLFHESQCGFRRGKSTIDILLRVENQIRKSINENKVCLVVYIDLSSAFDTVWGEGMIYKLMKLGVQGKLLQILCSFLENRKIKVTIGGESSTVKDMNAGTPQGAVLSPILFNIMMQDIPQMENISTHIFADDVTVTTSGVNMKAAKQQLQIYLKKLEKWCDEWGLRINLSKTILQYFTKQKTSYPIIRIKNTVLQYKKHHKLLGLTFDAPKLDWRQHVKDLNFECRRRINIMKSVSSTVWGGTAKMLRTIYIAYIRSKIDYGSIVYGNTSEKILSQLDIVQNIALRLILGARNTTPILSLQSESYLPPLKLRRSYLITKKLIELRYDIGNEYTNVLLQNGTNENHPNIFKNKACEWMNKFQMPSINGGATQMMPKVPPWISIKKYVFASPGENIENETEFKLYMQENFPNMKPLFTDGSKIEKGNEKSVASGYYNPEIKLIKCWKLNPIHSVLIAELFALLQALKISISSNDNTPTVIFTDSKSALQLIQNHFPKTYKNLVHEIQNLLIEINSRKTLYIHWIRGHSGINGNEIADAAANKGHENNRSELLPTYREEYKSLLKEKFTKYWNDSWNSEVNITGKGTHLRTITQKVHFNEIIFALKNRRAQVIINRLRMGHIGVKAYLHRFKMAEEDLCQNSDCHADELPETIEHFMLICPAYQQQRETMTNKLRNMNITDISLKMLLLGEDFPLNKQEKVLGIVLEYLFSTNRVQKYF